MGGTIESFGLRFLRQGEAALFSSLEAAERPYPWSEASFPSDTLVYEIDQGIVGFAVVKVVGHEAYLSNIMTLPRLRRRGFGGEMLQKVMMWAAAKGAQELVLDVDTQNSPAVCLYKKVGFEILQQRAKAYPRGEDAFVMRKKL